MATVRTSFHELGNWLNKISLGAIVTREVLSEKDIEKLPEEELRQLLRKSAETLAKIEQFVIGADKTIEDFKPHIYSNLDPDVEIS